MRRIPVSIPAAAALLVYGALCVAPVCAATVAYWRFESGSFLADSAGSNTLTNTGVAQSADTSPSAPGSGSADFNGSQTAFSTIGTLNLTAFQDLTVECFFKTNHAGLVVLFEQSPAVFNSPGAFGSAINDLGNRLEAYQRGASGTYIESTNLPVLDNAWHHLAMTIDGSEANNSRITLFIDGVAVGFDNPISPSGTPAFLNEVFHIGSRLNTELRYVGLLDEIRISDRILSPGEFLIVPEPTIVPLIAGAILMRLGRRRGTITA